MCVCMYGDIPGTIVMKFGPGVLRVIVINFAKFDLSTLIDLD